MLQALIQFIARVAGRLQRPAAAHDLTPEQVLLHETQTFPESLARVAASQIGVTEGEKNNTGAVIEAYQRSTWLAGTGWPWCAAFVCWCVLQVIQTHGLKPQGWKRPRTAGAWDLENWAAGRPPHDPNAGWQLMPFKTVPRRGDIVTFNWSHVGICTGFKANGQVVYTVEGNASLRAVSDSTSGDGVVARTHPLRSIRRVIRFIG